MKVVAIGIAMIDAKRNRMAIVLNEVLVFIVLDLKFPFRPFGLISIGTHR